MTGQSAKKNNRNWPSLTVFIRISLPQFSVRGRVGHDGKQDVLDDLQDVDLDQLPRQAVGHAGVDVVQG